MTFTELMDKVREEFGKADVHDFPGKLAFEFHITGDGGGTFYTEVKDGRLSIEPYEYYDRDARLTMSSGDLLGMMAKKVDPVAAFTLGRLKVEGDLGKALEIQKFLK